MVNKVVKKKASKAKSNKNLSTDNSKTREKLKHTPFDKAEDLKKASNEVRQKVWERLETARIFNQMVETGEFGFVKEEFKEGLKCKYGKSSEHLVKVYSNGKGIEIDINENLVSELAHSGAFVETLIRSTGDTFSKSYYQSKGILPSEFSLDEVVKALQNANKR